MSDHSFNYKQRPQTKDYERGWVKVFGSYCGRCLKNPCECAKCAGEKVKEWKAKNTPE